MTKFIRPNDVPELSLNMDLERYIKKISPPLVASLLRMHKEHDKALRAMRRAVRGKK